MEDHGESCELEQLVGSDGEGDVDDSIIMDEQIKREPKVKSPMSSIVSNKVSSIGDNISQPSISHSNGGHMNLTSYSSGNVLSSSRLMYVNEKKSNRDFRCGNVRTRNDHKDSSEIPHHSFLTEVPDVRNMERALIGLLGDFHSGKLRAFGTGCSMEQMTDIREQQERLARLHFDLGASAIMSEPPLSSEGLRHSQNTMSQLVQRLQQLSVSIEQLHSSEV